jgi:hypothetical protein
MENIEVYEKLSFENSNPFVNMCLNGFKFLFIFIFAIYGCLTSMNALYFYHSNASIGWLNFISNYECLAILILIEIILLITLIVNDKDSIKKYKLMCLLAIFFGTLQQIFDSLDNFTAPILFIKNDKLHIIEIVLNMIGICEMICGIIFLIFHFQIAKKLNVYNFNTWENTCKGRIEKIFYPTNGKIVFYSCIIFIGIVGLSTIQFVFGEQRGTLYVLLYCVFVVLSKGFLLFCAQGVFMFRSNDDYDCKHGSQNFIKVTMFVSSIPGLKTFVAISYMFPTFQKYIIFVGFIRNLIGLLLNICAPYKVLNSIVSLPLKSQKN